MFEDEGVPDTTGQARPADPAAGPDASPGTGRPGRFTPDQPGETLGGTDAEIHLREVIRAIAADLVDDPGAVAVASKSREQTVYLNLRVADGELGKVIGRQGRTARAIRTAAQIAGARHDVRVSLDIEG